MGRFQNIVKEPLTLKPLLEIFSDLEQNISQRLGAPKYKTGLKLHSIKLWETPTSIAVCTRKDAIKWKNTK